MKTALVAVLLGVSLLPLRAEDWTTSDGRTFRDVQVLSHNSAYVTILDRDGGARLRLSTLNADLQKRFGYDAARAPAIVAATEAQDRHDKQALAEEKSRLQAEEDRRLQQVANGIAAALFAPMPAGNVEASLDTAPNSPPSGEELSDAPPIASEPGTEIDDFNYDADGVYGAYGAYGGYYGGYGAYYGYGSHRGYGRGPAYGRGYSGSPARTATPYTGAAVTHH